MDALRSGVQPQSRVGRQSGVSRRLHDRGRTGTMNVHHIRRKLDMGMGPLQLGHRLQWKVCRQPGVEFSTGGKKHFLNVIERSKIFARWIHTAVDACIGCALAVLDVLVGRMAGH